jgi:hypothetical protein
MPAEARGTSKRSAKAFVRYYVDVLNHAMATGDTERLSELGATSCGSCEAVVTNIQGLYVGDGHLEGEGWEVRRTRHLGRSSGHEVVQAVVQIRPQDRYETGSGDHEHYDGGQKLMTFRVTREDGEWLVQAWDQAS